MNTTVVRSRAWLRGIQTRAFVRVTTALQAHGSLCLGAAGAVYLVAALLGASDAVAQNHPQGAGPAGDYRIHQLAELLMQLVEGNAGSLIMVLAGIGAIISAAFGAYRAAVSLIVVAVGAFVLRSLVEIFFNFGTSVVVGDPGVDGVGAPPLSRRYTLSRHIY